MKTALLVIDMQKEFGEMVKEPLKRIQKLNDYFNQTSRLIVFTQHGHTEDELVPPIKSQLIRKVGPDNALMYGSET